MTAGFAVAVVCITVALHFAFIGYLVAGGFVAWRWPPAIWLHIPVVVWGMGNILVGLPCPLTSLERWARARAGMDPLPGDGFIAHYLTGVLYPGSMVAVVQVLVLATVLTSWTVFAVRRRGHDVNARVLSRDTTFR